MVFVLEDIDDHIGPHPLPLLLFLTAFFLISLCVFALGLTLLLRSPREWFSRNDFSLLSVEVGDPLLENGVFTLERVDFVPDEVLGVF